MAKVKINEYTIVIERGESGYLIGSVVELPGCHTQGKTIESLLKNVKEAIELYLEVEKPKHIPDFIGIQRIRV